MGEITKKGDIEIALSGKFSKELLAHSLRVEELAVELALACGIDKNAASTAALLHDYGKSIRTSELLEKARSMGIEANEAEKKAPYLLHSKIGSVMACKDFDLTEEVALAIKAHTYGRPDMAKLDKIIYLADSLDPERGDGFLGKIREMAFIDIDQAFKTMLSHTIKKLVDENKVIHPVSIEIWNNIAI